MHCPKHYTTNRRTTTDSLQRYWYTYLRGRPAGCPTSPRLSNSTSHQPRSLPLPTTMIPIYPSKKKNHDPHLEKNPSPTLVTAPPVFPHRAAKDLRRWIDGATAMFLKAARHLSSAIPEANEFVALSRGTPHRPHPPLLLLDTAWRRRNSLNFWLPLACEILQVCRCSATLPDWSGGTGPRRGAAQNRCGTVDQDPSRCDSSFTLSRFIYLVFCALILS
jgi:hypothetical protein